MSHKFQLIHKSHMSNFHNTHHSIQESCHTHMAIHHIYIYTYVSTYKHTQAITTHPKVTKQLNHTLSRPAPRSGGKASLRRDSLTQTSPPPPRRGLETRNKNHCGVSHKARSLSPRRVVRSLKMMSRPPGRFFAKKGWASLRQTRLGEPDSPGRD